MGRKEDYIAALLEPLSDDPIVRLKQATRFAELRDELDVTIPLPIATTLLEKLGERLDPPPDAN